MMEWVNGLGDTITIDPNQPIEVFDVPSFGRETNGLAVAGLALTFLPLFATYKQRHRITTTRSFNPGATGTLTNMALGMLPAFAGGILYKLSIPTKNMPQDFLKEFAVGALAYGFLYSSEMITERVVN
tara:strand:- start:1478 stop:1861 length:384 start_codon:yes stop_codon:yes gene_type:complete